MEFKLSDFMNGGVDERVQKALEDVVVNILDPNTEAKKSRTVTLKLTITPWEDRKNCNINALVSTSLASPKKMESIIRVGASESGFEAVELGGTNPYQRVLDENSTSGKDSKTLENVRNFENKVKVVGK